MWVSYAMAGFIMILLGWKLFLWFNDNKSLILLIYMVAASILFFNIVISVVYTTQTLEAQPDRTMKSIGHRNPISPDYTANVYQLSTIFTFATMWIATGLLLKNFITFSRFKFWSLMLVPLVYFLTQFQPYLLTPFSNFIHADPVGFYITYTILFTAIELIGGLLFGLAFWVTAKSLESIKIKNYLLISGSGFLLFFASNHPAALTTFPLPPFGLIQICYIALSSYLIFTGIYSSAITVAQDNKLRQAIRDSIQKQQANFVEQIGTSEMSELIYKRTLGITKKLSETMREETNITPSLTLEQVKSYIDEVMLEKGLRDQHQT
jgi:hypothetical protein